MEKGDLKLKTKKATKKMIGESLDSASQSIIELNELIDEEPEDVRIYVEKRIMEKRILKQPIEYEIELSRLLADPDNFTFEILQKSDEDIFELLARLLYYRLQTQVVIKISESEVEAVYEVLGLDFTTKPIDLYYFDYDNPLDWLKYDGKGGGPVLKESVRNWIIKISKMKSEKKQVREMDKFVRVTRRNILRSYLNNIKSTIMSHLDYEIDFDIIKKLAGNETKMGYFDSILARYEDFPDMKEFLRQIETSGRKNLKRFYYLAEMEHALAAIQSHKDVLTMFMRLRGATEPEISKYISKFNKSSLVLIKNQLGYDHVVAYILPIKIDDSWIPIGSIIIAPGEVKSTMKQNYLSSAFLISAVNGKGKSAVGGPIDELTKSKQFPAFINKIMYKFEKLLWDYENSLTNGQAQKITISFYSELQITYPVLLLYGGHKSDLNAARRLVFDDKSNQKLAPFTLIYRNSLNIWQVEPLLVKDYTKIIESDPQDKLPKNILNLKIPQIDSNGDLVPNMTLINVEDFRIALDLDIAIFPQELNSMQSIRFLEQDIEKLLPTIPDESHSFSIQISEIIRDINEQMGENYFQNNFDFLLKSPKIKLLGPYTISSKNESIDHDIMIYIWDLDISKKYKWKLDEFSEYIENYLAKHEKYATVLAHIDDKFQAADSLGRKLRPLDGSIISKDNEIWVLKHLGPEGVNRITIQSPHPISQMLAGLKLIAELTNNVNTGNYYLGITGFGNMISDSPIKKKLLLQDTKFPPTIIVNPFFNDKGNLRTTGYNWYQQYLDTHENILWVLYEDLGYTLNLKLLHKLIKKHPARLPSTMIKFIVNLFDLTIKNREICFFKSYIRENFGDFEIKIQQGTAVVSYKVINQLNYQQIETFFEMLELWFQKRADRKFNSKYSEWDQRKLYSSSSNVANGTGTIKEVFKPLLPLIPNKLKNKMKKFEKLPQPWSLGDIQEFNQLNHAMIGETLKVIRLVFKDIIRDLIPKDIDKL